MNFFAERAAFQAHLAQEKQANLRRNDVWGADQYRFPHVNSPEKHTLEPILGLNVSLQSVVSGRREQGLPTNVLELFGSADFLSQPEAADSLTGIRLQEKPYEAPSDNGWERLPHHDVVIGDIYEPDTLARTSENLQTRGISSIDIAVCAPFCGWNSWDERQFAPSVFLDTYYPMLQWTYGHLNENQGMLFTELPPKMGLRTRELQSWEDRMNDSGIATKVVEGERSHVAAIMRQPYSPDTVVPLQGRCLPPHLR